MSFLKWSIFDLQRYTHIQSKSILKYYCRPLWREVKEDRPHRISYVNYAQRVSSIRPGFNRKALFAVTCSRFTASIRRRQANNVESVSGDRIEGFPGCHTGEQRWVSEKFIHSLPFSFQLNSFAGQNWNTTYSVVLSNTHLIALRSDNLYQKCRLEVWKFQVRADLPGVPSYMLHMYAGESYVPSKCFPDSRTYYARAF